MVSPTGADGKDVKVGWDCARPRVSDGQLGRHGLVESGCRRWEYHGQIVIVTYPRGTDILNADIDYGAAADRAEIPAHRASPSADCAARRRALARDGRRIVKQRRHG